MMGELATLPKDQQPIARFRTTVDGPTHHYQGWIRVAVYDGGIYMQWEGDTDWYVVTWWEMAHFARVHPPKLRDELDDLRAQARAQGLKDTRSYLDALEPEESPQRKR